MIMNTFDITVRVTVGHKFLHVGNTFFCGQVKKTLPTGGSALHGILVKQIGEILPAVDIGILGNDLLIPNVHGRLQSWVFDFFEKLGPGEVKVLGLFLQD